MFFKLFVWFFFFLIIIIFEKKNDKVEFELNYDVIIFKFDWSNVDIRILIVVIEIKCVCKSK